MQLRNDVLKAILVEVQKSEINFDRKPLDLIYEKDVVDRHLVYLIETHLVEGRVIKGISPPSIAIQVLGLTAAGHRHLGIANTSKKIEDDAE